MTIRDIRRKNLHHLIAKNGGQATLSRRLGLKTPAFISQIATDYCGMGNRFARRLEREFLLSEGWMDVEHTDLPVISASEQVNEEPRDVAPVVQVAGVLELRAPAIAPRRSTDDELAAMDSAQLQRRVIELEVQIETMHRLFGDSLKVIVASKGRRSHAARLGQSVARIAESQQVAEAVECREQQSLPMEYSTHGGQNQRRKSLLQKLPA